MSGSGVWDTGPLFLSRMRSFALLELVRESVAESKTAHFSLFFTFFQLRSFGYAPSKRQKLTKNLPVFAIGRKPRTCSERAGAKKRESGKGRSPKTFFVLRRVVFGNTILTKRNHY